MLEIIPDLAHLHPMQGLLAKGLNENQGFKCRLVPCLSQKACQRHKISLNFLGEFSSYCNVWIYYSFKWLGIFIISKTSLALNL